MKNQNNGIQLISRNEPLPVPEIPRFSGAAKPKKPKKPKVRPTEKLTIPMRSL